MIFALVFLKFFWDLFYFPFRPFMLNALNLMSLIFLFSDSVFGLMLNIPGNIKIKEFSQYRNFRIMIFLKKIMYLYWCLKDLETAFQSPQYLKPLLILINALWLVAILAWIGYAVWKAKRRRIWPSLYSKEKRSYLSGQNERFVEALEEASKVQNID